MKYVDEFRNRKLVKRIANKISKIMPPGNINIMEVCGTHTQSFRHFGLDKILPSSLKFIAGPGCPVCVSNQDYIDRSISLARMKDVIILSFGDMLRVPGTQTSLEKQRAEGSDVRVLYSPWDSLKISRENPGKRIVFLAVGFETTTPTIALTIKAAKKAGLKNLFFHTALKLIPPAMQALVADPKLKINGFLCPGHVSAIIGINPYEFIPKRYKIPCSVTGFEPLDILEGIYLLLQRIVKNKPAVVNQYRRVVTRQGNLKAKKIISEVFGVSDVSWRGLGIISKSGLRIRDEFSQFNAEKELLLHYQPFLPYPACPAGRRQAGAFSRQPKKCRCADILKGLIAPIECPLFSKTCSPDNPIGPCMVSSEGACNAYYKYR